MLRIQNRLLRIVMKTLLYAGAFVLFLLIVLSVYIEINKKEMLADFKTNLGKKINGNVSYSHADLSVWNNFPFIGLEVSDARLTDSLGTPLLSLGEVSLKVSILQYFRSETRLSNVSLKNGTIHLFTDSSGYTNKYLFDSRPDSNQQKNRVDLDKVHLDNVRIIIENRQKNKRFDVLFKELDAGISNSADMVKVNISQSALVNGLGFNLAKGSFLKDQSFKGNVKLKYDKQRSLLSFDETKIRINEHPYLLSGQFRLNRPGSFRLDIKTKQAPFEAVKRIFAENTYGDMKNVQVEKPIDVEARLEGSLAYKTIPKVTATWKVKESKLVVPVATITGCSFTGSFTNEVSKGKPLTDENSGVSLTGFSGNWEGIHVKSDKISIVNLVQPSAEMSLRSSTDLEHLDEKLGLRSVRFLTGSATLDFQYSGPLQKDVVLADKLSGRLKFSNATIKYLPRDFTFNNCSGDVVFSADALHAERLEFDLGSNHFDVDINGTNLSSLSAKDPGTAVIECRVSSPSLDLAGLKSLFSARKQAHATTKGTGKMLVTASKIDDALDHGKLKISLRAATVRYNDFMGRNLQGNLVFYNNDLHLSDVSIDHADGTLLLSGTIAQRGQLNTASAKVRLSNVDVSKVFKAFNDFGQDGISHDNLRGRLSAGTNVNMSIDHSGNIIPGTMNGTVDFSLKNGALVNFEPMQNIKGFVFKKKDMSNVTFAELKNKLEISNYKIRIPRMEIQSSAIGMFVEGVYDLRKTESKFDIQVPVKGLKKRDSSYVPQNIGLDAKAGTSIYLEGKNDKTGKVKIGLNTTKTLRKIF